MGKEIAATGIATSPFTSEDKAPIGTSSVLLPGIKTAPTGTIPLDMLAKKEDDLEGKLSSSDDIDHKPSITVPKEEDVDDKSVLNKEPINKFVGIDNHSLGIKTLRDNFLKNKQVEDNGSNITNSIDAKTMAPADAKKLQLMQTQIDMLSQIYTAINNINSAKESGSVDITPMTDKLEEMIDILRAQTEVSLPRKKQSTPREVAPPAGGTGISVAKIPITSTTF